MLPLQIPTDNLYKFIFVTGIVFIFSSSYLFVNKVSELNNQLETVEYKQTLLEIDFYKDSLKNELQKEFINSKKETFEKNSQILKNRTISLEKKQLETFQYELGELEDSITAYSFALIEMQGNLYAKQQEIKFELRSSDRLLTQLKIFSVISIFGFIIGIATTLFGYQRWLFRIQIPSEKKQNKSSN